MCGGGRGGVAMGVVTLSVVRLKPHFFGGVH
jgi:hypothetical protein